MQYECRLTVLDNDTVALTDLNRQFYYKQNDIGQPKVKILEEYLWQYHNVRINIIHKDVFEVCDYEYDLMFCCFDNVESRMQLNYISYINNIPMIDLGIEGLQMHVKRVDFATNRACLYCMKELYGTKAAFNYCTLKNTNTRNREAYIYSLSLKYESVEDVVEHFNAVNAVKTDEFEVRGIKENILPNACYIASLCASMALKMVDECKYDFIYYNGYEKVHFNFINMVVDPACILCNAKMRKPVIE
ncbi:putative UBA/THIF-type [Trachipleistophora hominis]|uniref:NEDD8-activating enzyme E1 catalytic subunit n=1 Tax=Trachipleistophora hominis TaxID=72359 RepID=L7JTG8_TRAHO|nr:putative UBA/THIF-type [Trachipleistophora hominis]